MADAFDLVVIGAGPGGYECAIKAAQLGLKVACVEKRDRLGGTCLNIGCIPSKALLHASELFHEAGTSFSDMGIEVSKPKLNLKQMLAFKDEAIDGNTKGIEFLFKKNKIEWVKGEGVIDAPGKVKVGDRVLETKNIVIATGSDVAKLPGVEIDEKTVVSSTGALELGKVPGKLVVVGGGVIGLELGSVWRRLGAEVTVVEFLDNILPGMDGEVVKNFTRTLKKQGFTFKLGTKVTKVEKQKSGLKVSVEPAKGGDTEVLDADVVLVAIGRVAYTEGLGLDKAGVATDKRGRVEVDENFKTNVDGIYALGDCIAGPMLAHKAMEEGVALAERLAGHYGAVNYDAIPGVVYTSPEVASVGKTEEQLKEAGIEYNVGKFPFTANGRAKANKTTDGFVKILADKKTDRVLGVHIIGVNGGEMIAEAVIAMELSASSEDIARICFAHPTMSEAVKEAALAVTGLPIHM
ncbi:dihydrolipoyl dehydrogenase [Parvibaculum sp.]|jgi:dihydrolipoamide dehydrogenase|uniref:dihydrolipoyl dehydrogenase n=1 Tax=Parvibaculum sp. TaxID=2024848 RepID=UPI000C4BDEA3|nr:dihydrolipoyl dehydrogenase [Parvibaculum sp.]MAM96071.1 dihydrolipoyl dehydrogenase [Parvibaculum sp.]HCX68326.1 dihydrolipoyl dehydrogenase [Rhodobiaceae bacterium]|tara:strand:+ start:12540 stop:13931 length:1392 start_codon:yes stop_codon:yes gene_type:complete